MVGASVRPWIAGGRRAGFQILASDFFADWDARFWLEKPVQGTGQRAENFLKPIQRFEDAFETDDWQSCQSALICGGFENRFDLVRRLGNRIHVLGPAANQLENIARSVDLFAGLRLAGFQVPETGLNLSPMAHPFEWLQKSFISSGGLGVQAVNPSQPLASKSAQTFFQEMISGESVSAVFVSVGDVNGANAATRLLGISRQLVGDQTFGAAAFRYCGSIGPIQLTDDATQQISEIAKFLALKYGIIGVWGIDFIVNPNGVWPVDINPRLTASAELLDSLILNSESSLTGIVDVMVRACNPQAQRSRLPAELDCIELAIKQAPFVEGKAILFNRGRDPVKITSQLFSNLMSQFDEGFFETVKPGCSIADVPWPGQTVAVGHPILTVRVRCQNIDRVPLKLRDQAGQIYAGLGIETERV